MTDLWDALKAIEGSGDLASIQRDVRALVRPLGYDRIVLFSITAQRDELVERVYWVEGDWFETGEAVDALTYIRRCPVTRHVLETDQPFFWTKTRTEHGASYRIVAWTRRSRAADADLRSCGPRRRRQLRRRSGRRLGPDPSFTRAARRRRVPSGPPPDRRSRTGSGDETVRTGKGNPAVGWGRPSFGRHRQHARPVGANSGKSSAPHPAEAEGFDDGAGGPDSDPLRRDHAVARFRYGRSSPLVTPFRSMKRGGERLANRRSWL